MSSIPASALSPSEAGQQIPSDGDWLVEGGEMGRRIRLYPWARTRLGPMAAWPQSLKISLRIMLGSRYQMFVWWGDDLINFYNEAYIPVLGQRHPWALGQPASTVWRDIWATVGPQAEAVLRENRATWNDRVQLLMERNGYVEETFFTFSYSPLPNDEGGVGGVFCACSEETERVLGERRLATLRQLGDETIRAQNVPEACELAVRALEKHPRDVSFALIYLLEPDGKAARLVAHSSNVVAGGAIAPERVDFTVTGGECAWPLDRALQGERVKLTDLTARCGSLPGGEWPEPTHTAMVLPLARGAQEQPGGFVVLGASPRRGFDDSYQGFMELTAAAIASAVANARAYDEERRRAEALTELDRAKTAFFSNVSHEFRTPLTLMLGPLEELLTRGGAAVQPAVRDEIRVVHRNSLRLLRLVNALLDFSQIEAGRMQATYVATDLAALTVDLASVFRSAMEKAELKFTIHCPPLPEPVWVDPALWEKIVFNLLSNALKFTLRGGVTVALTAASDAAILSVSDTGLGIASDELPNLFKRFHRIESTRGRTHEGTGIGLALVHDLVKLHGGTVAVESGEGGRGTTFKVRLPFGRRHLPAERIGLDRSRSQRARLSEEFIEEATTWVSDGRVHKPGEERSEGAELIDLTSAPRVLLADDNADMREYVGRLLGGRYRVQPVVTGLAALAAARRDPPDLILSDVMMPEMDGFGLVKALRADEQLRSIPIILLSARAGEEARVEGVAAGADDYVTKPFTARELLARVATQLELSRVRREAARAVRESEARYRALVENQTEMICRFRRDGTILFVNESYARSRGTSASELVGENLWKFVSAEDRAGVRAMIDGLTVTAPEVQIENRFETIDGPRWTFWTNRAVSFDSAGRWLEAQSTGIDITDRKRAEIRLRASEDQTRAQLAELNALYGAAPVGLALVDHELRYVRINETLAAINGVPVAATLGRTVGEIVPTMADQIVPAYQRVLETGEPMRFEVEGELPSQRGSWGHFVVYHYPLHMPDQVRGVGCVVLDVTEQKRAEVIVRESEAHQSFLLKLGDLLRPLTDPVAIQAKASQALGEHLAAHRVVYFDVRDDEYVLRRNYTNGVAPLTGSFPISSFGERLVATYRAGQTACWRDVAADPELTPAERTAYAALQIGAHVGVPLVKNGEFVGGFAIHSIAPRDWKPAEIALAEETAQRTWAAVERARAESALRESEARLRLATEAANIYSWEVDLSERRLWWGTNAAAVLGLPPATLTNSLADLLALVYPDDLAATRQPVKAAIAAGENFAAEFRLVHPQTGETIWVASQGAAVREARGGAPRYFGISQNITERKRRETNLAFLAEIDADLARHSTADKILEAATRRIGEFLRLTSCGCCEVEQDRAVPQPQYVWTRERGFGDTGCLFCQPQGWNEEFRQATIAGKVVVVRDTQHDSRVTDPAAFAARDVRSFVTVPFVRDGAGKYILAVTDSAPRPWRSDEVEVINELCHRIFPRLERAHAESALRESESRLRFSLEACAIGAWDLDLTTRTAFRSLEHDRIFGYERLLPRWTLDDFLVHALPEYHESIRQTVATGRTGRSSWASECRIRRADGAIRWIWFSGLHFTDGAGHLRVAGVVQDVTERKEAEAALQEAHRMLTDKAAQLESLVQQRTAKLRETVGELEAFSYSIAHDMRAPLRSLQGFSDVLLSEHASKLDPEAQGFLRRIAASAGRMDRLIQDVLNYSRIVRADLPLEKVDVESLLRDIIDTYPMFLPEKVDIALQGPFPPVLGNEAMLTQIFSNLMGNAAKFVAPEVKPRLRLWAEPQGTRVRFLIQDNGIGIAPALHEKIFGIFQQANKGYEGTGIGLAIVKKAVERMGGKVGLESESGQGSTFWFELQRA